MTHTYAIMKITRGAYDEIRAKLLAANYQHALEGTTDGEVADLHGIAVQAEGPPAPVEEKAATLHQALYQLVYDNLDVTPKGWPGELLLPLLADALHAERRAERDRWQLAFLANGFTETTAPTRMTYREYVRRFADFDRRRKTFLRSQREEIVRQLVNDARPNELLAAAADPLGVARYWVDRVCAAIEACQGRKG